MDECCQSEAPRELSPIREVTVLERLRSRKDDLQSHLERINQAIAYLEKNPELEQFMSCVRGTGCF